MNHGFTLALLAALVAAPAVAQTAPPVRGQCKDGRCDEFQVISRQVVVSAPVGKLVRTRSRSWTLVDGQRRDPSEDNGYVFCSLDAPALVNGDEKGATAAFLAPLAPNEYKANINFMTMYFEVCHGAGKDVVANAEQAAISFGYTVSRTKQRTVKLSRPEGVVQAAERTLREQRAPQVQAPQPQPQRPEQTPYAQPEYQRGYGPGERVPNVAPGYPGGYDAPPTYPYGGVPVDPEGYRRSPSLSDGLAERRPRRPARDDEEDAFDRMFGWPQRLFGR